MTDATTGDDRERTRTIHIDATIEVMLNEASPEDPTDRIEGMVVVFITGAVSEDQEDDTEETLQFNQPVSSDSALRTSVLGLRKELETHLDLLLPD